MRPVPRLLQLYDDALDDLVVDALQIDLPRLCAVAHGLLVDVGFGTGRRWRRVLVLDGVALGGRRHGRRALIVGALDLLGRGVVMVILSSTFRRSSRRR